MNILILYATTEGQTAKIAERMAEILRQKEHEVITQSGEQLPATFKPEQYDAAIIGGSIHMGHYPGYLNTFISKHRDWLNTVPSAFFTVCMGIRSKQSESREEAAAYSENFIKETNWHPALTATFAGAVKYTQYNFITRFIMKRISKQEGGSTDTSRDHEYTDWDAVTRFTEQFESKLTELQDR
ncbi:MAG: menaquinone-dependent protoporphyrinogen IX dehydrogenase [Gammaproteobacteria bacterium]|jgi:menaquinone-dependent protoporphyrinogen oxidase